MKIYLSLIYFATFLINAFMTRMLYMYRGLVITRKDSGMGRVIMEMGSGLLIEGFGFNSKQK